MSEEEPHVPGVPANPVDHPRPPKRRKGPKRTLPRQMPLARVLAELERRAAAHPKQSVRWEAVLSVVHNELNKRPILGTQ